MSKQMKILVGIVGVAVVAAVVLTMFGKPPNLPLGPLQGMLASDDASTTGTSTVAAGTDVPGTTTDPNCDPVTGLPLDSSATGGSSTTDPNAAATGAGTGADATAGTATPPATSTPGATAADAGTAAGTGAAADPTAAADPAAATNPAATAGTTVDPTTGAATPDATAGATGTGAATTPGVDPCADATGTGAGTGTGTGTGAAGTGAGANAAANADAQRSTSDGTNSGNNAEALRIATDATGVMQKAQITVSTTATLVPGTGGVGNATALKRYRATVAAATLVIKLDASALEQWTTAGRKVQLELVKSFSTRLQTNYPKATRSVTIVDSTGTVLAIGDATASGGAARVKLF